jgi:HEAT repeat protein
VTLSTAILALLVLSGGLLLALTTLVAGRKVLRDRRERRSLRRRAALRSALEAADAVKLRRRLRRIRRRDAQADLIAVLRDPATRLPDPATLERAARRAHLVHRIERQLRHRQAARRGHAVLILAHLRWPGRINRLEDMLGDPDGDVRLVACAGLPLSREAQAVDALVRALARREVTPERVIEQLGQPWAVEPMLAALRGLDATGERRTAPRVGLARALGVTGDRRSEPALLTLLDRGREEERISAARALGAVGGPRSVAALELALADDSWPLRAQAAKALGKLGDPQAVPALETVLTDRAWWVRANAATALAELGEPGLEALGRALGHTDLYARDRAAETLTMHRLRRVAV